MVTRVKMNFLVTGGTGFIGRWTVKKLLDLNHKVWVLDNLSNSSEENIQEFRHNLKGVVIGDIKDKQILGELFRNNLDVCIHLAASIDVQKSIDNPQQAFDNNIIGTFNLLEESKKNNVKFVFMSSALVYCPMKDKPINEEHETWPSCVYTASKIAGENLALSYYNAYKLPVVVLRPFTAYGPYQKTNAEGGVTSIFIKKYLAGEDLEVFGDGTQTRDLVYVEDYANFIVKAALSEKANGQIINAGSGKDISINELAFLICKDRNRIKHIPHHHPQAEIEKMICDYRKAKELLNWTPEIDLETGIRKTEEWVRTLNKSSII